MSSTFKDFHREREILVKEVVVINLLLYALGISSESERESESDFLFRFYFSFQWARNPIKKRRCLASLSLSFGVAGKLDIIRNQ